jgi:hypothetical protein
MLSTSSRWRHAPASIAGVCENLAGVTVPETGCQLGAVTAGEVISLPLATEGQRHWPQVKAGAAGCCASAS